MTRTPTSAAGYPRHLGAAVQHRNPSGLASRTSTVRPQFAWRSAASGHERLNALLRLAREDPAPHSPAAGVPGVRSEKMARVEAALLVADRPLSPRKLAQQATLVDDADARAQIELLNDAYELDDSPFRIEPVATGFQLLTRPEFAHWLDRRHHRPARMKLSQPAMETLTIVAYRQPVTRADVEAVRGVQSGEMLKQLMDRGLVRISGEDDSLGRPYLYATTRQFLEHFGLRSLDDLPDSADLRPSETSSTEEADDYPLDEPHLDAVMRNTDSDHADVDAAA